MVLRKEKAEKPGPRTAWLKTEMEEHTGAKGRDIWLMVVLLA